MPRRTAKTENREAIRDNQRVWLEDVLRRIRKTASQLAHEAGLSDTTLTRFLNHSDHKGVLSPLTINQIVQHTGIPGPAGGDVAPAHMVAQEEAYPFDINSLETAPLKGFIRAYLENAPRTTAWVMRSDTLSLQGIIPGDVLLIDEAATPHEGDVVCAQLFGATETEIVFRIYQHPYIIAAPPPGTSIRPELVDGQRVRIVGVMSELLRHRKPRTAIPGVRLTSALAS